MPRHPPYALSSLTNRIREYATQTFVANAYKPNNSVVKELRRDPCRSRRKSSCEPSLGWLCSSRCPPYGGGKRTRTADPLLAKQVLSQLSYTPAAWTNPRVVGLGRFELPTSRLSGVRSNQLSYRPIVRTHQGQGEPEPALSLSKGPDVRSKLNRNVPAWSKLSIDLGCLSFDTHDPEDRGGSGLRLLERR